MERKNKQTFRMYCTVLIGHHVSTVDTLILLCSGTSAFLNELKSLGVMFADSLVLMKLLRTSSINSSLLSKVPDNKLGTVHYTLVSLEKNSMPMTPLRLLKHCRKYYSIHHVQNVFEHGQRITAEDAIKDVQFLDKRHAIVQT